MTKLNLWDALKPTMLLQRVHCVSPLKRVGNQVQSSLILSIYGYTSLLTYYGLLVYSVLLILKVGNIFPYFQQSYLWSVIGGFELLFNNVGFIFLIILSEFKKHKQSYFLNRIYAIDLIIMKDFQAEIKYKNLRFNNFIGVLLCLLYYEGLTIFVMYFLHDYGLTSFGLYIFAFLYQYEQISSGTITWTYINYVLLIRERFRILKNVQIELTNNTRIRRSESNLFKISKLFETYKDLCSMIDLINDNNGLLLIIRISHDFTLTTSQVYLISWVFMDSSVTNKTELLICIFLWMIQNIVKICLTTLSAELTVEEALNCGHILDTHNRESTEVDVQNMLGSFDHWMLHRKIEFTANNFFKIDLTLLYSIIGALASYTLILIQFKQQEESLSAESSTDNIQNITTKLH